MVDCVIIVPMYNHRTLIRLIYIVFLFLLFIVTYSFLSLIQSTLLVFNQSPITIATDAEVTTPFPVSVNPALEVILEQDQINIYPSEQLARAEQNPKSFLNRLKAKIAEASWYQNLASPVARVVVIWPGERKEEAADNIGDVLRWTSEEKQKFIDIVSAMNPVLSEGKIYPGQYVAHRDTSPDEMAEIIHTEFVNEILNRYTEDVAAQVPLKDALTIASLLEREASDFQNMREVSGVIWNRLFIDMPLQLDATLQYARANKTQNANWWPTPAPSDKFITSPYNTYSNQGLPPGPIASPSSNAILAALNPIQTDCYYYFHDDNGSYHCSTTYEEHVGKLKATFGRGR